MVTKKLSMTINDKNTNEHLSRLLNCALIPRRYRSRSNTDIEAMLDTIVAESLSDEKLVRMLGKIRGEKYLGTGRKHKINARPSTLGPNRSETARKPAINFDWSDLDEDSFVHLVGDLLSAEGHDVKWQGAGPDGGLDLISSERVVFGFNDPQPFKWGVQCKFSWSPRKAVNDTEVRDVMGILLSSRYQAEKLNGYMLVTNRRVSQNVVERLRGINDQTSFRTCVVDGTDLSLRLQSEGNVACKYFRRVGANARLLLTGEYKHSVEEKSRLLISNKLRRQIDPDGCGRNLYIVLGANGILCLYHEEYYEQMAFAGRPELVAPDEAVAFERITFALSSKAHLDDRGRLRLDESLRKRAGLKDNITLVGVRDHVEMWNSQDWEQYLSEHMAQYQKQMTQARRVFLQKENRENLGEALKR